MGIAGWGRYTGPNRDGNTPEFRKKEHAISARVAHGSHLAYGSRAERNTT
jgi:hypothetical protein